MTRRQGGRRGGRGFVSEEHALLRASVDEPRRIDEAFAVGEQQRRVVVREAVARKFAASLEREDIGEPHAESEQPDKRESRPEASACDPATSWRRICYDAFSSWYSSSTFTDQMSWFAPSMFSTDNIAVYIE